MTSTNAAPRKAHESIQHKGSILADREIFGSAFAQNFLTPLSPRSFRRRRSSVGGKKNSKSKSVPDLLQENSSSEGDETPSAGGWFQKRQAPTTPTTTPNTNKRKSLAKKLSKRISKTRIALKRSGKGVDDATSAVSADTDATSATSRTAVTTTSQGGSVRKITQGGFSLQKILLTIYFIAAISGLGYAFYDALKPEKKVSKKRRGRRS